MTEPVLSPDAASLDARLTAIEATVARLAQEMAALRAELHGAPRRAAPSPAPTAVRAAAERATPGDTLLRQLQRQPNSRGARAPHDAAAYDRRSSVARRLEGESFESLVGRYGMLVLATVTALAAVGTFLGWAIAHGLFGPVPRVVLGVVTAVGVMIGGYRLRRRERTFGSTLMALGLAMLHVAAWAAGPSLHLVPSLVAFAAVGLVSWGMAVFAQAEGDEALWCAGFGGAAIAPFVTSNGGGQASLLASYGAVVLVGGGYALASRPWRVAGRILLVAAAIFTGALMAVPERELGPLLAMALPLVVCMAGVLPFADRPLLRARLRGLGMLALAAAVRFAFSIGLPMPHLAMAAAIGAAGVFWLVLCDRARHAPASPSAADGTDLRGKRGAWIEGFVLPLGFVACVPAALDAGWRGVTGAFAVATVVPFVAMMRRARGAERDALVGTTVVCALATLMVATHDNAPAMAVAIAALALVFLAAGARWASWSWIVGAGAALVGSSVGALAMLTDRVAYAYQPFGTAESFAAAAVLVVWFAAGWLAPRACDAIEGEGGAEHVIVSQTRRAPWVFGFLWVHQEIAWAVNPTVATLLRVSYYALTSVLCVGIGRWRDSAGLRHVGLGLALVAGGTALYGTHGLTSIAARVASYLVVSIFLLAIAYWYRRRDDAPTELDAAASR